MTLILNTFYLYLVIKSHLLTYKYYSIFNPLIILTSSPSDLILYLGKILNMHSSEFSKERFTCNGDTKLNKIQVVSFHYQKIITLCLWCLRRSSDKFFWSNMLHLHQINRHCIKRTNLLELYHHTPLCYQTSSVVLIYFLRLPFEQHAKHKKKCLLYSKMKICRHIIV